MIGRSLYYVVDSLEDTLLIEDCFTLKKEWMKADVINNLDVKEVNISC